MLRLNGSEAGKMVGLETRQIQRDSLLLVASMRVGRSGSGYRIKVRNLSAGGMMAEGDDVEVDRGAQVMVELRNIGAVAGSVAWVEGNRFGIAFADEIDPRLARDPVSTGPAALASPRFTRPPIGRCSGKLRTI